MSTKKTPALRSAWALMLVVPLAALVPPGRPPRTTKLDAATLARRRERREALKPLLTWPEEQRLGRECRRLAALEDVRAREGARLRRAPTRGEWAAAANYSSEAALRADRARMRACRDELIARNLRLVLSVAGRYKPQPGLEFDDLVAEGNFGLAKAAARFDPGRGFRFSTYAVWWIRQAISHAVGHDARAIRLPAHVHDKLRPVWKSTSASGAPDNSSLRHSSATTRPKVLISTQAAAHAAPARGVPRGPRARPRRPARRGRAGH
jgi:RNA polymerase sigma factor (sigma-70 family)